ncbi:MAG: hypothetical protein HYX20_01680 [Candidatus Yanofskybacteria bacterium]|nr:hypothetical protein [Candidatus Yanofskybacteria bacterium]
MKRILDEIRQQPEHIRHIFLWLCVVITFSVIGFVWFRQTTKQFIALMHPEEEQARILAEKNKPKHPSPFATIFNVWGNLRANISELLTGPESNLEIQNSAPGTEKIELPPQKLPISE